MAANRVRGHYLQLREISQTFSKETESIRQMLGRLQQAQSTLENGHWVGKSADKFYQEMNSAVLPALKRLATALETASQTTQKISQIIKQAEADSAALFKANANNGAAAVGGGGARVAGAGAAAFNPQPGAAASTPAKSKPSALTLFSLEDVIRKMLSNRTPADPIPLLKAIQEASPAERLAVLNNPELMAMLNQSLGGPFGPGVAYTAALLEGQLNWKGPSGADPKDGFRIRPGSDFANWIRGGKENTNQPDVSTGSMNCWEFALFSAYKLGQVSYPQLVNLHNQAAAAGQLAAKQVAPMGPAWEEGVGKVGYKQTFENALGASTAQAWSPGVVPPAGDMVFFGSEKGPLTHVAISLGTTDADGNTEVMSLWNGHVVRTTVEKLVKRVQEIGVDDPPVTFGKLNVQ